MKPRVLCSQCQNELQWGDKFCVGCGQPVEWPGGRQAPPLPSTSRTGVFCKSCGAENHTEDRFCETCGAELGTKKVEYAVSKKHEKESRGSKKATEAAPVVGSWKIVVGFVVFLAVGVFVLESLTSKRTVQQTIPQQVQSNPESGANMQVLPQIEELERRVAANPNDAAVTLELANLLHDNRFYDKSIRYYKAFLQQNPKEPNARVDMAICYKELGDLETAKSEMKQALQYDPKHLFAHFNLGIVNLIAGNVNEANDWFRKTVALAPNSEVGKRAQQLLAQHNARDLQTN